MNAKTTFKAVLFLQLLFNLSLNAQNWQYVGSPYINSTSGPVTAMNYGDIEHSSTGDFLISYVEGTGTNNFKIAKYNGSTWTQLSTTGLTAPASPSRTDLEVDGLNYYFSYCVTVSSASYVYVFKYNSGNWLRLGDSLLLGSSGASGYDLLIDNIGAPTLVGPVPNTSSGTNKTVMKYNGSAWSLVCTLANSSSTAFNENSAAYDSQNKLYCAVGGGYVFNSSGFQFYSVVHKVVGSTDGIAGDTMYTGTSLYSNMRLKINASDVPFLCTVNTSPSKTLARKLNGGIWTLIGDTSVKTVPMTSFDIDVNNKVVFCGTSGTSPYPRRLFIFDATTTSAMDTLNTGYAVGAVPDLLIPTGTSDVYQLEEEIKTGAIPDMSVMKHSAVASGINEYSNTIGSLNLYPNPSGGVFYSEVINGFGALCRLEIYDSTGKKIKNEFFTGNRIDLTTYPKGIYLIRIREGNQVKEGRIIIE